MSTFPLPDTQWEPTRGFFEGAARGELCLPRCDACGELNWYPRKQCRYCAGEAFAWHGVSGRARLFSFTHVQRALFPQYASKAPYVTGLVTLAEDPRVRVVTRLVDCEPSALVVDMPVEAVFRTLEFPDVPGRVTVPMFCPADPPERSTDE